MTTTQVKEIILDLFRSSKCKVGHMVPVRTVEARFYKMHEDYAPGANELIAEGLIEYRDGRLPGLLLTQSGYDQIYYCRSDKELMDLVMSQFKNTGCKEGQGYMFRTLNMGIIYNLNPKEQEQIFVVLNKMIDEGYMTVDFENNTPTFLRLTQKGYEYSTQL